MELIGKINAANLTASVNSVNVCGALAMYKSEDFDVKKFGVVRQKPTYKYVIKSNKSYKVRKVED